MSTEHSEVPAPTSACARAPARIGPVRIILGVLILAIPIAAALIWWMVPAGQEVSAAILVDGYIMPMAVIPGTTPLTGDALNRQAAVAAASILDESTLRKVMNDQDVRTSKWYKQDPDKQRLLDMLKRGLKVRTTPDTGIVIISLRAEDSGDAARIVNTVVRCYLDATQHACLDVYSRRLDKLMKQESGIKRELKQIRDQRETLISSQLGSPGLASGVNLPAEVCRFLVIEQARLDVEANRLKVAYETLKALGPADATRPTTQPVSSAPVPAATRVPDQVAAAEAEYLGAKQLQVILQEKLDAAKSQLRDAERKMGQYDTLTEELTFLQKQRDRVSDDINNLQLMMRDYPIVPIRQISVAVADSPEPPR